MKGPPWCGTTQISGYGAKRSAVGDPSLMPLLSIPQQLLERVDTG